MRLDGCAIERLDLVDAVSASIEGHDGFNMKRVLFGGARAEMEWNGEGHGIISSPITHPNDAGVRI